MSRQGIRGGTIHSLDEAQVLHELTKPEVCELVRSSILDVLVRTGTYTADDLLPYDLPVAAENVIGGVTAGIARKGLMRKVGWVRSENPARHGAENRTYVITDKGRAHLARAGVGAGGPVEPGGQAGVPIGVSAPRDALPTASTDPGTDVPELAPLPRPGGGDLHNSQPGTAVAPEVLTLPLGDVPQAQAQRASYEDWDVAA